MITPFMECGIKLSELIIYIGLSYDDNNIKVFRFKYKNHDK